MDSVGVVGVGAMGSVFVERFVAAGLRPLVFDVSAAAVERAVALGGVAAASPLEIGERCDIVDVMVRNDAQMLDSVLGEQGVLNGLSAGKILLLHSTIHPRTTRTIAEAAKAKGVAVADACISAVPSVLRQGATAIIVGSDPELLERIRPHLLRLGPKIFHMGPVGQGNATKVLKNLVMGSQRLILAEALRVAEAAGISNAAMLAVLRNETPALGRGDESFEGDQMVGAAHNMYDAIMPVAIPLVDEYEVDAPIVRALAAIGEEVQDAVGRRAY